MMKKKTENKYALLKQLVVLPLLAILVMSLSNKEVRTELEQNTDQLKVVVDGVELPPDHPDLIALDFTNRFDGGEVIKALHLEDKLVANSLSFDKNPKEDGSYYIRTSDYVPGTNPRFENRIEGKVIKKVSVKGKVTNENEEPLPGTAVLIKGTTTGTITDMEGNFEIQIEAERESIVIFTMPGYTKKEVVYEKQPIIDVSLKADGSANSDKIKVVVYKSPLIMIDGVKSTKDVNDIDPENIKSIDVLKDASAFETYGEEAKDGVILINTKSEEITSEMDLRKFIAKKMKYPQKAQQANKEGIAELFVKVNGDGIIYSVSEKKDEDAISISEIVVVAYAPAPEEIIVENKKDDLSKSFISVTKSVINQLPKLDIADFKGKTIAITVKFMLQ